MAARIWRTSQNMRWTSTPARWSPPRCIPPTRATPRRCRGRWGVPPRAPAELIADKGYHSRGALKALDGGAWKSRISEPKRDDFSRWHGDDEARRAVYNNRARLCSGVARQAFKLRAELVERGFALILDRGGMRRVWLRGRENIQKRYLIHVAGYNLGLIMRLLTGAGTPREFCARVFVRLLVILEPDGGLIFVILVATGDQSAAFVISVKPDPCG